MVSLRRLLDPRRRRTPAPAPPPEKPAEPSTKEPDRFDAARDRLRAEIPPPSDGED